MHAASDACQLRCKRCQALDTAGGRSFSGPRRLCLPASRLPLQDSLGGNAKTSLLVAACDAAEHVDETLQSLQFGLRAMCVRTQVRPFCGFRRS